MRPRGTGYQRLNRQSCVPASTAPPRLRGFAAEAWADVPAHGGVVGRAGPAVRRRGALGITDFAPGRSGGRAGLRRCATRAADSAAARAMAVDAGGNS